MAKVRALKQISHDGVLYTEGETLDIPASSAAHLVDRGAAEKPAPKPAAEKPAPKPAPKKPAS